MVTEAVGIPVTKHRLSSERKRIIDQSEDSIHLLVDDGGAAVPHLWRHAVLGPGARVRLADSL